MGKKRTPIPNSLAAQVLFGHDRTCSVCRKQGNPVQIHHIDDDPNNNDIDNLTVLCFDCHRDTQIKGGFDRKLDADQIFLYKNDWLQIVQRNRFVNKAHSLDKDGESIDNIDVITGVAEVLRENKEFEILAMHYDGVNDELRDKYIEKALAEKPEDSTICFLRSMQNRPDLIPDDLIDRELARYNRNNDYSQRARFQRDLGRYPEAVCDYLTGVLESMNDENYFSAAFYLKERYEYSLVDELLMLALKKAEDREDLWWQIRALQELEWQEELKDLLLKNRKLIEKSEDYKIKELLAAAMGKIDDYKRIRIESAKGMTR